MKVSFGGNHLIITNNTTERDNLHKHLLNKSRDYLFKVDNNKLLYVDGKEAEDIDNLACAILDSKDVKNNAFNKAIVNGYKEKAIIIDLRDNEYKKTLEANDENLNRFKSAMSLEDNYTKLNTKKKNDLYESPLINPAPEKRSLTVKL